MAQLVYLTHGLIEDRCNNAAVGVAGRSGVAFAEAEAADEAIALLVVCELEVHAFRIVVAASKAVVLLQADVGGVVALACGFLPHTVKSIKPRRTQRYTKETNQKRTINGSSA